MSVRSPLDASPANGDVLIVKKRRVKRAVYVLSVMPNPGQIQCRTYHEALATAARWASTRGGRLWSTDDERTFTLISTAGFQPPAVTRPVPGEMPTERFERLVRRVEREYLEMPGLQLTREQAQRLWALDRATCVSVLDALIDRRFLARGADHRYRRALECVT